MNEENKLPALQTATIAGPAEAPARRKVLHVGCGPAASGKLHHVFRTDAWNEVRLDIDPRTKPDVVASITDMRPHIADCLFDAVWSSHNIEHLYDHEVAPALGEMQRVLKPDGFALITCPSIESVAEAILSRGIEEVVYQSPAGPVAPLDMLYGFRKAVAGGNEYMAHRTGFTEVRLGRALVAAGFAEVRLMRIRFDLWALALGPDGDVKSVLDSLEATGLAFGRTLHA